MRIRSNEIAGFGAKSDTTVAGTGGRDGAPPARVGGTGGAEGGEVPGGSARPAWFSAVPGCAIESFRGGSPTTSRGGSGAGIAAGVTGVLLTVPGTGVAARPCGARWAPGVGDPVRVPPGASAPPGSATPSSADRPASTSDVPGSAIVSSRSSALSLSVGGVGVPPPSCPGARGGGVAGPADRCPGVRPAPAPPTGCLTVPGFGGGAVGTPPALCPGGVGVPCGPRPGAGLTAGKMSLGVAVCAGLLGGAFTTGAVGTSSSSPPRAFPPAPPGVGMPGMRGSGRSGPPTSASRAAGVGRGRRIAGGVGVGNARVEESSGEGMTGGLSGLCIAGGVGVRGTGSRFFAGGLGLSSGVTA